MFEEAFIKKFCESVKVIKVNFVTIGNNRILEIFLNDTEIDNAIDFVKNFKMDKSLLLYSKSETKKVMEKLLKNQFQLLKYCEENGITPFIYRSIENYIDTVQMDDIKYIQNKYFGTKNMFFIVPIKKIKGVKKDGKK